MDILDLLNLISPFTFTGGLSPLSAPVLQFVYSTASTIRLSWTDASGGDGNYTYTVNRDGSSHATGQSSPYDDSVGVSSGVLYSYTVTVTDGLASTAVSNAIVAALPFDGTGGGGVVDVDHGDRLILVRGDDHTEGDRLPAWTILDYAGPSMVGGTCVLRLLREATYTDQDDGDNADLEVDATIAQTGTTIRITAPITSAQSETLKSAAGGGFKTHQYQLRATTSAGRVHTLLFGPVWVTRSIEAPV